MVTNAVETGTIRLPGAPDVPGLSFRHFRGEADLPAMLRVLQVSKEADGIEEGDTLEQLARQYSTLKNSDPYQDMVMVEGNGELVGYRRVLWYQEENGPRIYSYVFFLVPGWRDERLVTAIVRSSEARLREIAADHLEVKERLFDTGASDRQTYIRDVLAGEGYESIRYFYEMVRPDLENIPDAPLPEGLEIRPVQPEHLRAIWEAEVEAFRDHWGEESVDESDFERWSKPGPIFQPHMWQVAWDGDQVAGMVRNFISEEENRRFNRKRGYTENISVRRPWRKKGLARALIAGSFRLHKQLGMTEAALGVDAENPNGALQLYKSMGFQVSQTFRAYRKQF